MIFIYAFMVQVIISPGIFFFILSKLWFSRFLAGGRKGKKYSPNNSVHCTLYLRNHKTSYDCHLWYTRVRWWLQAFSFFQNFDFSVKGQKMVQNEKRFCLLYSISQEPYIIWLSFVVDKCKMIISPVFFLYFFKILVFWFVSGIKGQKMTQNDTKLCVAPIYQEAYTIWSRFLVHIYKRMTS